ncbi:MAG: hypothetical protein H0W96_00260 [Solirubrobacterales bacterium]|nr:hypothetical protein [Solirubrobacterales bacterium]
MAVVVASTMHKTGPTVSGDVEKIVVVQTDLGFANDLVHTGTGKIVATVCG